MVSVQARLWGFQKPTACHHLHYYLRIPIRLYKVQIKYGLNISASEFELNTTSTTILNNYSLKNNIMAPRVWLITGCSSGFGEAFVHEILWRGDKVIATARNLQSIRALADAGAETLALDVSASVQEIDSTVNKALGIYGRIDVFLSNAGYVHIGGVEETT